MRLEVADYVLGLADMTGEAMRLCINAVGLGDAETPRDVAALFRELHPSLLPSRSVGGSL